MQHPHVVESERCPATVHLEDAGVDSLVYARVTVSCDLQAGHDGDHHGTAQDGPVGSPETHPVRWPRDDSEAV